MCTSFIDEAEPPTNRQTSVKGADEVIWLAPRFDQVLRLYGKSASVSEEVADTLTTATKQSATSFEEMLVAMIVAGGGVDEQSQKHARAA